MSASYVFHSGSESDTRRFGEQLAGALPDGGVVDGDLKLGPLIARKRRSCRHATVADATLSASSRRTHARQTRKDASGRQVLRKRYPIAGL